MDLKDLKMECRCGGTEFEEFNGFYYCVDCGQQVEGMQETGLGDEADVYNGTYSQYHRRAAVVEPVPQTQQSEFWTQLTQSKSEDVEMKLYVPADFGSSISSEISSEDYAYELRTTYVMGIELMIEYQCQALVEEFGISPLICGLTGVILLRFVAASQVFDEKWASQIAEDSEMQIEEDVKVSQPRSEVKNEPRNLAGKRLLIIWLKSLRRTFPLSLSLSICYLACHIAREPILPTDLVMWAHDGKLPFLNAFDRIGKVFGNPSAKCPLSTDLMFRPVKIIGWRELESQAGYIAECIGLELPPVNFNALARRYLKQLQLPQEEILQKASMIYDWSMPPDLWLSSSRDRIPSRVCVMSIIVVAIRIMYNINGYGKWEQKYCSTPISPRKRKRRGKVNPETKKKTVLGSSYFLNCKLDAAELLGSLELTYEKIRRAQETGNLSSYLKLCKDVVFGAPSDNKEKIIVDNLWEPFEKGCTSNSTAGEPMPTQDDVSVESVENRSLNWLKSNMKENGFYYIPPRHPGTVKNVNYLHYETKKNAGGTRIFAAHADYYILLRVCALVAEADIQYMYKATSKFEKRLAWLEKNIDRTLKPSSVPNLGVLSLEDNDEALELSEDKPNLVEDSPPYMDMDDSLDFSNYKFGL
ncbi:TATA box-binding protein-associated factor RNA polymerase I subunit B-like [Papaver somniferum]|uniref:TATA box-binding protein-associated factor RNA polymerase I subunit B-like n=1 Tax=Papaver somniferum TaxID=3469 RepID=UPI000E7038A6|nr:TATA box-binding protein-associated factor RNA polymerase I subunit B-like [Papaver somniferum]